MFIQTDKNSQYLYDIVKPNDCNHKSTKTTEYPYSFAAMMKFIDIINKWERKEIELDIDFDEYMLSANEELLKEVWINLIDNAVKFSPQGGTLSIKIEPLENSLLVSVSNIGTPIPDDKKEAIFHKFYKLDKAHSSDGNGIGLAIVKRIVDLHKGSIDVTADGETVTFTVTLPCINN